MLTFDVGISGITPYVTITRPDGTLYAVRTSVGLTEVPAGSGSYDFEHPEPGVWLKFTFDATLDGTTISESVWDDGVTPQDVVASTPVMLSINQPYYAPTTWLDLVPLAVEESVQAVKAKTDALPTSPAATGDAMTLTEGERTSVVSAVWAATTRTLSSFGTLAEDVSTIVSAVGRLIAWKRNPRRVQEVSPLVRVDTLYDVDGTTPLERVTYTASKDTIIQEGEVL